LNYTLPTPENTNERGYYFELIPQNYSLDYNYLLVFCHVEDFYSIGPVGGRHYYFGLILSSMPSLEEKVDIVEKANALFCEDETRVKNYDRSPEMFLPYGVDGTFLQSYTLTEKERLDRLWRVVEHNTRDLTIDPIDDKLEALVDWLARKAIYDGTSW
jgi:hypothetical protein